MLWELNFIARQNITEPRRLTSQIYGFRLQAHLSRANRDAQSVFYCSSDPSCAFSEIDARIGQLVVHATWVTTRPMLLHDLGYSAQVLARAGSRRELPERHHKFYESSLDADAKMMRDFIALAFTDPGIGKYALSTGIAEVHLRADEFSGVLYPAVSRAANVDNLALRPEFVRSGLRLDTAQLVSLDEIKDDGSLGGVILADMRDVSATGSLAWQFRGTGTSLPPGAAYAARPGTKLRVQDAGELEIDGKRYHVEPGFEICVTAVAVVVRDLQGQAVDPVGR